MAALASLAGVVATVFIATSANDRGGTSPPNPTPPASAIAAPSSDPSGSGAPPSRSATAGGPVVDVASPAELQAVLNLFRLPDAAAYPEFELVKADEIGISAEAPNAWPDRAVHPWLGEGDETVGWVVVAAPDERGLYAGFEMPGIFFGASVQYVELADGDEVLSTAGGTLYSRCSWAGSADYASDGYTKGRYEIYTNCGETPIVILQLGAMAADGSHAIYLHARMLTAADIEAVVRALETFSYDPTAANPGAEAVP